MSRRARFSESDSRLLRGGVDRNGGAGKTVQLKGGSPPARRRGSKHPCPRAPAFFDPSPPARRRGSKLFVAAIETRQKRSPPARRRGSKRPSRRSAAAVTRSPPARRRGSQRHAGDRKTGV